MNKILFIITMLLSIITSAQENPNLKPGSMVYGSFNNEDKIYTAEIISSNNNEEFQCRFSHSGSVYTFNYTGIKTVDTLKKYTAKVISTKGGTYKPNDEFKFSIFHETKEKNK